MADPKPTNLRDLAPEDLAAFAATHGVGDDVARRIFAAVHKKNDTVVDLQPSVRGLSKLQASRIDAGAAHPRLEIVERRQSPDGFVKYLFRLHDGHEIEAVRIPLPAAEQARVAREARRRNPLLPALQSLPPAKLTICVSSQAGCALACGFCATGRLGGIRSLATWEILAQVRAIADESDLPVRGVVFMGMGEPFLNYDNVIRAACILCHPAGYGVAAKGISISTAGVVPAIRRFTADGHRFRLIVSLGAPTSDERLRLMPIERRWPLPSLVAAIRDHAACTGQRVTIAYVTIGGTNTSPRHARQIADLFAGIKIKLNLIDVTDPTGTYRAADDVELANFRDALDQELAAPVVRRYSGGRDIEAACGTLSASQRGGVTIDRPGDRLGDRPGDRLGDRPGDQAGDRRGRAVAPVSTRSLPIAD